MAITRFYLFVNDLGTTIWRAEGKLLLEQGSFAADLDGMVAFEAMVARHAGAHWHLLFDLLEEDYRIETIPHANPRDRKLMAERRLQQLYRESGYRSYTYQGRETEGRRDHRVLFAALTNPTPLDRWIVPLVQSGACIAGVYSIALLCAKYIGGVKGLPRKALIVSRQRGSGLRQTYIADGALRFARLTAIDDDSPTGLSDSLISEAARARQFLASLRALERDEALQVVMLCSATEQAQLRAQCPDAELIQYQFLDMVEVARAIGSVAEPSAPVADPMWLHLVLRRNPANQYATGTQRKSYVAWRLGKGLLITGAMLLLGGLLAGSYFWRSSHELAGQVAALEQRTATAEATYAANLAVVKEGELTPTGMKNVVQSYRQLVEEWPRLADGFGQLSGVLGRFPMVDLEAIVWQVSPTPAAVPQGLTEGDTTAQAAAAPPPEVVEAVPGTPSARYLIIGISGKLLGYQFRYREALALVDEVAKALQWRPDAKVEKLQLPIDTRPEATVDLGSTHEGNSTGAPFALKVVIPLTVPPAEAAPGQEATQ